jgi:hypothetical protein
MIESIVQHKGKRKLHRALCDVCGRSLSDYYESADEANKVALMHGAIIYSRYFYNGNGKLADVESRITCFTCEIRSRLASKGRVYVV